MSSTWHFIRQPAFSKPVTTRVCDKAPGKQHSFMWVKKKERKEERKTETEKDVKASLSDWSARDDSAPPALTLQPPLSLRPPSDRQLRCLAGRAEAPHPAGVSGEDGVTTQLTAGRGTGLSVVVFPLRFPKVTPLPLCSSDTRSFTQ